MSVTALGVITNALIGLNVYASGEPIKPADANLALSWLNQIFDQWTLDPQANYASSFQFFPSTGVNPETVGPSGTFVVSPRPAAIDGVAIDVGSGHYREIYTTADPNWWAAQLTPIINGIPWGAYYQPDEPNGSLYFNFALTAATSVRLQLRKAFAAVALSDTLVLATGVEPALTLTLMETIAESFHATVSPSLEKRAGKARALIFSKNLHVSPLSTVGMGLPGHRGGWWDYRTGQWRPSR